MATKREVLEGMMRGEGCLGKAADGEPIFVLRANDLTASITIHKWANYVEQAADNVSDPKKKAKMIAKAKQAHSIADQFAEWSTKKLPD